jgi:hypothetical protein
MLGQRLNLSTDLLPSVHLDLTYLLPCPSPVKRITKPPIALAVAVHLAERNPSRQRSTRYLEARCRSPDYGE